MRVIRRLDGRPDHLGHLQGQPPDSRRLAGQADVAQAVRTVRGDLEIDDREASGLDAGDLESAQANLVGDRLRIAGHAHEVTQPGKDESHSGNCSRNRRSFS